jgi:hypothetical protein
VAAKTITGSLRSSANFSTASEVCGRRAIALKRWAAFVKELDCGCEAINARLPMPNLRGIDFVPARELTSRQCYLPPDREKSRGNAPPSGYGCKSRRRMISAAESTAMTQIVILSPGSSAAQDIPRQLVRTPNPMACPF